MGEKVVGIVCWKVTFIQCNQLSGNNILGKPDKPPNIMAGLIIGYLNKTTLRKLEEDRVIRRIKIQNKARDTEKKSVHLPQLPLLGKY